VLDAAHLDRVLPGVGLDRDGERLARVPGIQAHRDGAARPDPLDAACGPLDVGGIDVAAAMMIPPPSRGADHDVAVLHLPAKVAGVVPAVLVLCRG
jgi:hypothetical protein